MRKINSNRLAWFIWLFTLVYAAGFLAMLYLLPRDGLPAGDSAFKVTFFVALFFCGLGILVWQSCTRCTTCVTQLDNKRLLVVAQYPFARISHELALRDAQPAILLQTRDSDGDPYFYTQISVGYPFKEPVKIAEGSREFCTAARDQFNALMG
jgi:hypothetical protein